MSSIKTYDRLCCYCKRNVGDDSEWTNNYPCGCTFHKGCAFELNAMNNQNSISCYNCQRIITTYQFGSSVQTIPKEVSPLVQAVSTVTHMETPVVTEYPYKSSLPTTTTTTTATLNQGFNYENSSCYTRLCDYCFHTEPYFLKLLYGTSILLIIFGLIDTILCAQSQITYQFPNSGIQHFKYKFIGGPVSCLVVPLLIFIYPKMLMVIVMLISQGLFTITFCIISADQFLKSHTFMKSYIYACVKDNNFYGDANHNSEAAACASMKQTSYCTCYYRSPIYMDVKENHEGITGSNDCVIVEKDLSSCDLLFGSLKEKAGAAGGIAVFLAVLSLLYGFFSLLSIIFTGCFHRDAMYSRLGGGPPMDGNVNVQRQRNLAIQVGAINFNSNQRTIPIASASYVNDNGPIKINNGTPWSSSNNNNNNNSGNYYDKLRNAKL